MFGEGCFWSGVFALWMDSHRHPLSKCKSAGTLCFCAAWWAFIHHHQVLEKRKLEQAAREAALQAEELNGRRRGRTQHSEALPSAPLMLGEIGRSLHHQRQKVRRLFLRMGRGHLTIRTTCTSGDFAAHQGREHTCYKF